MRAEEFRSFTGADERERRSSPCPTSLPRAKILAPVLRAGDASSLTPSFVSRSPGEKGRCFFIAKASPWRHASRKSEKRLYCAILSACRAGRLPACPVAQGFRVVAVHSRQVSSSEAGFLSRLKKVRILSFLHLRPVRCYSLAFESDAARAAFLCIDPCNCADGEAYDQFAQCPRG